MSVFGSVEAGRFGDRWLPRKELAEFERSGTTGYRLCSLGGGWVERLGADLLISYKDDAARDELLAPCLAWPAWSGVAIERIFGKYLPRQNAERVTPVLLRGDATLPLTTVVRENGVAYGLDFGAGYSAGLFLDQRANRAFLRRIGPRRALNTFAYTCSFSVAAALAGATTVSVDLSKKSLDRGRANFALNGLDPAGHKFMADSVLDVLPRLARRGERFDAIILDPPTFSRDHDGAAFQVERDFEPLLLAAMETAAPAAHILLSTNCTRLDRRALEAIGRYALKATRRAGSFHVEPAPVDIPADLAATTVWLDLK
ncbi:MAG TPA: class I SAM-dependent methyltransferase [Chthoniobacteraceae bacterium]|jgi:23S rRNA (cytosine1962-C5)-methyltransferase|nr:class I SAM-dependent methyltransferase [Chthoniobacteraceae bacterium]